jgi:hypothetical protein
MFLNNYFYIIVLTIFIAIAGFVFFLMYPNKGIRLNLKIEFFLVFVFSFAPFLILSYLDQRAFESYYIEFDKPAKEFSIWKAVGYNVKWLFYLVFVLFNNEYVVTRLKMTKSLNEFESKILTDKDIAWQRLMGLCFLALGLVLLVYVMNEPYFVVSFKYQR